MTISEALCYAITSFEKANISSARLDGRLLLQFVLGCDQTYIVLHPDTKLSDAQSKQYANLVSRRASNEPVAKIIGVKEFWSLPFYTTKDTLDPRPDSETLIETIVNLCHNTDFPSPRHILDIGTGTGCLLLSLLHEFPEAKGVGVDISKAALSVSQKNAHQLGLSSRTTLLQSNWLSAVKDTFDLVISNPPYIPKGNMPSLAKDLSFDPQNALTYQDDDDPATEDGLSAYRHIAKTVGKHLNKNGHILVEYGQDQHEGVKDIFQNHGFVWISDHKDLAGIIRCSLFKANHS